MGSYSDYVDSTYNNRTYLSGSGTMQVPEVTQKLDNSGDYDPCNTSPIITSETPQNTISMSKGGGAEGDGTFTFSHPDEVEDVPVPIAIMLREISSAVELIGCNDVSEDWGSKDVERHDSYYVERGASSWEVDYTLDFPIAKYASGVIGDEIYFFGGVHDNTWVGTDGFYKYNVKTKVLTELSNGGLSPRSDSYGCVLNGKFYMLGGYENSVQGAGFRDEFLVYNGSWSALDTPDGRTNKIVGGNDSLYIADAMIPNGAGWTPDGGMWKWSGGLWVEVYYGDDYVVEEYHNFETFHHHKGIVYYFNEGRLRQIIDYPDYVNNLGRGVTTDGVIIPIMSHNPKMCSYGDYIIFSHGYTDGGASVVLKTSWYNPDTGFFGDFGTVGDIPQVVYGFDIHVIDDILYMIGGIPENGTFEQRVWKLRLKPFFDNIDYCGATPIPPDTFEEQINYACSYWTCDRDPEDGIPDWYQQYILDIGANGN